jgi:hypothetical protein
MNEFERLKQDALKAVDSVPMKPQAATMKDLVNSTSEPDCGYIGPPRKKSRGSVLVGLILCCFFIIPGIFYFMLKSGYRSYCPRCGLQISADN